MRTFVYMLTALVLLAPAPAAAQQAGDASGALAAVERMFEGMRTADSAMVRSVFCGVNAIDLLRDATGWKITQVADTRRRERCPDPLKR